MTDVQDRTRQNALSILDTFEDAVRDHAFKGSLMPEDHFECEERYVAAKKAMVRMIEIFTT